jgi:hypothetical protein
MLMSDAKKATISRFTNLLDGGIIHNACVSTIIDYYEAQLKGSTIAVKNDCSITKKFIETQIQEEYEDEYGF